MKKLKINVKEALAELMRRVRERDTAVREFLSMAGISPIGSVTVENLRDLHQINPDAFKNMIRFLYPDIFSVANGDGEADGAEGEGGSSKGSGLSDTDKAGIFNLFGSLIDTAGDVAGQYVSGSDKTARDIYQSELEQEKAEQRQKLIWGIVAAVAVITICVVAFVATRPNANIYK